MDINTINNLSGPALHWAVATALGLTPVFQDGCILVPTNALGKLITVSPQDNDEHHTVFTPSTSFAQGGELINNVGVDVRQYHKKEFTIYGLPTKNYQLSKNEEIRYHEKSGRDMLFRRNKIGDLQNKWFAKMPCSDSMPRYHLKYDPQGDTMLLAAMRCLVMHQLDEHTEIPSELLNP